MRSIYFGLLLVAFSGYAQETDKKMAIQALMKAAGIPGLSLSYVNDQKFSTYSLGITSIDTRQPVADTTLFSGASLSKTIFAYGVFKLSQAGKINLDKPLVDYSIYPDVAHDSRSRIVTARMILSHSAGLPNWRNGDTLKFKQDPGKGYSYSGEGFVWLSRVVEGITGQKVENWLDSILIRPLGMTHTAYVWKPEFGKDFAWPHNDFGKTESKYYPEQANVAHSLQTTAADYSKFVSAMLQDKKFLQILSKDTGAYVARDVHWKDGLGKESTSSGPAFFQWGDNGSYKGFVIFYPGKKEGLVYFANSTQGLSITRDLLKLFFPSTQPAVDWLDYDSVQLASVQVLVNSQHMPVAEAIKPYLQPGKQAPDTTRLNENQLNQLAYRFLQARDFESARYLFVLNQMNYPASMQAADGLAEILLRTGKKTEAVAAWRAIQSAHPDRSEVTQILNRILNKPDADSIGKKNTSFRLEGYSQAALVSVAGSFNGWNDLEYPMHWENGSWSIVIPMSKGDYVYKYVVDGVWIPADMNATKLSVK